MQEISKADVLIAGGSSLTVNPAASLVGGKILSAVQANGNMVLGIPVYGQQILSGISLVILCLGMLFRRFSEALLEEEYPTLGRKMMLVIVSGRHSRRRSALTRRLWFCALLMLLEKELALPCVRKVSEAVWLCTSELLWKKRTPPPIWN